MPQFKFLHTMIRVRDLDRSIAFYRDLLGMNLLSRDDYPGGKFTLAFLSYGQDKRDPSIELTHNWDQDEDYDLGNGFGHLALGVEYIVHTCEQLREAGAVITREPGPMKHGTTEIAFIRDPDGYAIELIQLGGQSR